MADLGPLSLTSAQLAPTASLDAPVAPPKGTDVRKLAQEFESLLLLQVMRQVRQTLTTFGGDDEAKGFGGDFGAMTDTIDGELSRYLSKAGGLGLGQYLERAMDRRQGSTPSGEPGSAPVTEPGSTELPSLLSPAPAFSSLPVAAVEPHTDVPADKEPIAGPERTLAYAGAVTSGFGWRRDPLVHAARFHGGVDLRAAYGQAVPAAGDGRVVFAGEQGGYGMTVVLQHPAGFQTRYAHLSSMAVRAGDEVVEGQAIGQAGRSGRATGPHVHLELTRNGQRLDPSTILRTAAFKASERPADYSSGSPSTQMATMMDAPNED